MAKQGFKVMDSDMHVMEPPDMWQRYIDPEFRSIAPVGLTSENVRDLRLEFPAEDKARQRDTRGSLFRGRNFERNQKLYADHARRGWTTDCQLEAMDLEGIDVSILFPTRGLTVLTSPNREPRFAAAIARAYNDWMFDLCAPNTRRLLGAGMLSVYNVDDAVQEVHRCVKELGFVAVFLRSNVVNGKNWHDPYYEPLWSALEQLSVPLGFHEAVSSGVNRSGAHFEPNFGLRRIYGQPFEQMLALSSFVCGGIMERHPRLKVAFLEANCSWAPWLIWRMDEMYELEGDVCMPDLTMPPSGYFKRQCFVSVEPDETPVRHMLEDFGFEQLVFSTDYPHGDSRYPRAVEGFLDLPLSDDEKRAILWDNCARLYSITSDTPSPQLVH